ncbi:hypothetical protein N566_04770, partial [Streptomycetaceae bacterium MP113-05]
VAYIARAQRRHRTPPERTCLVGFSQGVSVVGAVLAHTPLAHRAVLVCGRLLEESAPPPQPAEDLRVLAVTGGRDRFVAHQDLDADLGAAGLVGPRVRHLRLPGLDHRLDTRVAHLAMAHATHDTTEVNIDD